MIDHIDMNGVWNVQFGTKEDVWSMLYDLQSGSKECQGSSGDTFGGGNICEFRQSLMDEDEGMEEKDVLDMEVFDESMVDYGDVCWR